MPWWIIRNWFEWCPWQLKGTTWKGSSGVKLDMSRWTGEHSWGCTADSPGSQHGCLRVLCKRCWNVTEGSSWSLGKKWLGHERLVMQSAAPTGSWWTSGQLTPNALSDPLMLCSQPMRVIWEPFLSTQRLLTCSPAQPGSVEALPGLCVCRSSSGLLAGNGGGNHCEMKGGKGREMMIETDRQVDEAHPVSPGGPVSCFPHEVRYEHEPSLLCLRFVINASWWRCK